MTFHIAIIGGGASGALLAAHLLRAPAASGHLRVTIVEEHHDLGKGIAYSTDHPGHLLNVRAGNMSAFPDDPGHFVRWMESHNARDASPDRFAERQVYGRYLASLLENGPVNVIHQACIGVRPLEHGIEVLLADGTVLPTHHAILATGYCRSQTAAANLDDPWALPASHDPQAPVVLIGTGLTMVDMVLSLLDAGQAGPIYAMSRRGLLPQTHASVHPLKLSAADIPIGTSIAYFTRFLRRLVQSTEQAGGGWRDVVDGLRPHTQTLWRHLPQSSRQRFLRHAATFWDVHRHRMPPSSAERIAAAKASGLLRITRGRFDHAERNPDGTVAVFYRAPSAPELTRIEAAQAIDCRGFPRFSPKNAGPLLGYLIEHGIARPDALGLGLDCDAEGALINGKGHSQPRLSGIGPVTRGVFWEVTAVPDIRVQAARLAEKLIATAG